MALPIVLEREHTPHGIHTPTKAVTQQTVRKMSEHIRQAQTDPMLQGLASTLAQARSPEDQLAADWAWAKHRIKFVHDEVLIEQLLNERDHFELLISPPVLLRMRRPQGDCDDFTMLLATLTSLQGFPTGIVTLACDRKRPGEYSHVFSVAQLPNRIWCPMDASHGKYPGWQVPAFDVQRRTEWNLDGQVVSDRIFSAQEQLAARAQGMGEFSLSDFPKFDTGLPIIGTIDLTNPMEWVVWGGAIGSALFLKEPTAKISGVAGFLGARFILQQMGANV